jgi:putative oxidoreductase
VTAVAAVVEVVEVVGRLALIVGFGTRFAALVLAFFTLVASFFFDAYWSVTAEVQMVQQRLFLKSIAVVGGWLAMTAFGAGAWSVDGQRFAR